MSLDGFRPDYLDLGITPNLSRLAREGVRADWMKTSYPSLTFPNHYTLVTGLRPDRHGIVHNTMRDAELGDFALSKRDALGDGRWWAGEPIWVGAAKAGLPSATLFWPG
ncbi:MAG: ectonucleotide pyrophosphatase/phosphodiesterase, partial [Pseudomonadota bacterium]|nr:ectonucleotide pyrophosphatase/phosphodiesterase [Pseudomonadota bacterium]